MDPPRDRLTLDVGATTHITGDDMEASTRRTITGSLIALGAALTMGWSANAAQAQSSCITQCKDSGWSYSQCNRYCSTRYGEPLYGSGRSYRYAPMSSGPAYNYGSTGSGNCGEYRYLKGGVCVDARTNPPDIR